MLNKLKSVLPLSESQVSSKYTFCLGVGAQRCGSTWLGKYLAKHPQFCMSPLKEMHVFDSIACKKKALELRFVKTLAKRREKKMDDLVTLAIADRIKINKGELTYFGYFDQRLQKTHKCFGEITPEYALLSPEYLQAIYKSHAKVKIFMLMRRPVSRYISALQYWGRVRPSFSLSNNYIPGLKKELFDKYTRYDQTISNLQEVIPAERLYFEYYENIFDNPDKYLSGLCSFLEIDYIVPKNLSQSLNSSVNSSPAPQDSSPTESEIREIYQHFSEVYYNVPRLISSDLPLAWKNDVEEFGAYR